RYRGHPVLGPRQRWHRHDADLATVGRPRHAVRHVPGDALLAGRDGPGAGRGERLRERAEREAEDLLDALALEYPREEVGAGGGHQAVRSTRRGVDGASVG